MIYEKIDFEESINLRQFFSKGYFLIHIYQGIWTTVESNARV